MNPKPQSEDGPRRSFKTALFDLLRSPLMHPTVERSWLKVTSGRPYRGLRAKLTPNSHCYLMPSPRGVERYGYHWNVDISDMVGWYLYFGFIDPSHDSFAAECRRGDVVLDVGANIGVTALRAAQAVGPSGRVFAFEPDLTSCQGCRRHVAGNRVTNVEVIEAALGEKAGSAVIAVRDPHNRGMNRLECHPLPTGAGAPTSVTTIDDFVAAKGMDRLDVIKVDVEGYEFAVLRGGRAALERFRPTLFLEIDDGLLAAQGESATKVLSFLKGLGYEVSRAGSEEVLSERAPLENIHFDVVCRSQRKRQSAGHSSS